MTVDRERLRNAVKAGSSAAVNDALDACLAESLAQVTRYIARNAIDPADPPPEVMVDKAVLVAAVDDWNRSKAPNGVLNQQYDIGDGSVGSTPIRISRDPLVAARPVLAQWCLELGFA